MKKIQRVFRRFESWECVREGMYDTRIVDGGVEEYAVFLSDQGRFRRAAEAVLAEWPIASEHFLSNPNINRLAWIGQASACMDLGLSCFHRGGFNLLPSADQRAANDTAIAVLSNWIAGREVQLCLFR